MPDPVVVVDVAVLAELPVGQALPGSDQDIGGESGGGELRVPCPDPPPVLNRAGDGGPPVITDWVPLIRAHQEVWPNLWIGP